MASRETNPDNRKTEEIGSDIPDLTSKIPGKLVSAKHANTGKLNLHLVSSTPMNSAKRAKFFDESNQFGSPIRSGGSSTDVNSNTPDNKIKILESEKNTKKTMPNEEQLAGASPFPFYTNLAVKKMTICMSDDDDSEDNIFEYSNEKIKAKNKLLLDIDGIKSDSSDSEINDIEKTEAIVEPPKKVSSDEETNVENVTKVLQKKTDSKENKNVSITKKASKSSDDDKENVNAETNKKKTKPKSQSAERNNKRKKMDNKEKSNLEISPKQRKLDENTVEKQKITSNKNDINNEETSKKKTTLRNDETKIKKAGKFVISSNNGVRKSSRNCAPTMPYWMAPWNANENENAAVSHSDEEKTTRSEEIVSTNITSVKAPDFIRPKTVPETATEKKEPKRNETKSENIVTLNRSVTKSKSESDKTNIKKESNETNAKSIALNRSKTRLKSEPEKRNIKKALIEENVKNVTLNNRTRSKVKIKETDKKTSLTDEVPELSKKMNVSKIKDARKKAKETQRNVVLKSNENVEIKETESNVPNIKKRQYSKEILDKENKEKKNKVENIETKIKAASPKKSNTKDSLQQTILENEVFEQEIHELNDEALRTLVEESIMQNNSKRENLIGFFKETEVFSPPRTSKRITDKIKKDTNKIDYTPGVALKQAFDVVSPSRTSKRNTEKNKKDTSRIEYTPGIALKQNKNDVKSTTKRKVSNTENKTTIKMEDRTLRSNTFNTRNPNKYVDEFEEMEDQYNSDSNNDNQRRRIKKRRLTEVEKPIKNRNKNKMRTLGLDRKRDSKMTKQSRKLSKQVNFNVNDSETYNTFDSDSLSSYENPSKVSCNATYNYKRNPTRQLSRSRDSKYPRKKLFYNRDNMDRRRNYRHPRYIVNDSTLDETDGDSWTEEEMYVPETKRRKYMVKKEYKKRKVDHPAGFLNFKENAIAVQVPAVTQTLTEIQFDGKTLMMECYGSFPKSMTKISDQSSIRGTCFMNNYFASGMMEITLGTIKKCNASNNHTYFLVLDGMAEIGIAGSVKIMRIGDCCIVPKHTFYYIANASSEVNLLLNFLKISL